MSKSKSYREDHKKLLDLIGTLSPMVTSADQVVKNADSIRMGLSKLQAF